jgi:hypothetical protein
MTMDERYPESRIQDTAVAWLAANWGYQEFFNDIGAVGARLDSAGLMDRRLVLIEVKVSVSKPMVRFAPSRSGSLEAKIVCGLGALYRGEGDALSTAANLRWPMTNRPLVVILARSFSDPALVALQEMFTAQVEEWGCDAAVWQWTGSEVEALLEVNRPSEVVLDYANMDLPLLIGRAARRKTRTLEELLHEAELCGQRELLELFIAEATRANMPLTRAVWTLSAIRKSLGAKPIQAIGFYIDREHPGEAVIGLEASLLAVDGPPLPGRPGPASGYLNVNRLITTADEMRRAFDLVSGLAET